MADFQKSYAITMQAEGYYSNHPSDRGGETWKGIARVPNPDWEGWKVVDKAKKLSNFPNSLKSNQELEVLVQQFYKKKYWDIMRLDQCPSERIASELFDTGVNMGTAVAILFLQQSLNALNKQGSLYADIGEDGGYGNLTHNAFMSFFRVVPKARWRCLYVLLNCLQGSRYISIVRSRPSQEEFMYGWMTRVFELEPSSQGLFD